MIYLIAYWREHTHTATEYVEAPDESAAVQILLNRYPGKVFDPEIVREVQS